MKKLIISLVLIVAAASGAAATSFSAGLGGDFVNYDDGYLLMQAAFVSEITENVEFELGGALGIRVEDQEPGFYLPFSLGLGFVFPDILGSDGVLGVGLTPAFIWGAAADGRRFYLGPHLKAGIRVPVHPFMQWYLDAQQSLLIGAPRWINNTTRVTTGIHFFFTGGQ